MNSFVYKWTNITLDKIYIGWHKGTEDDGYICSSASAQFWDDFNNPKYKWKREILHKGTMPECQLIESQLLDSIDITLDTVYNNKNNLMFNLNDEVRSKLKTSALKRGEDPEYRKAQSERTKAQWAANPERRRVQSEKAKRRVMTDETKEKIREARRRQIITPESRAKAAEKLRGRKYSKEHGDKVSAARLAAPVVMCPHCDTIGKLGGSMSRWHFDNCRAK